MERVSCSRENGEESNRGQLQILTQAQCRDKVKDMGEIQAGFFDHEEKEGLRRGGRNGT